MFVTACQGERHGGAPLGEVLEILRPVEGLERIRCIELERAEEGFEFEAHAMRAGVERIEEFIRIGGEDGGVVVVVVDEEAQAFEGGGEATRGGFDGGAHVGAHGIGVGFEADASVLVIQVEQRVERMVVRRGVVRRRGGRNRGGGLQC